MWAITLFAMMTSAGLPSARSARAVVETEELGPGRHPDLVGGGRLIGGRIEADDGDTGIDEVLEEVAVVAGELDHQRLGGQHTRLDQTERVVATVAQEMVGERGEVEVVVDEQLLGFDVLGDLHEGAVGAERHGEREPLLAAGIGHDLRRDERVGERRLTEVEELLEPRGPTSAARRDGRHDVTIRSSSQRRSCDSAPVSMFCCSLRRRM